MSTALSRKANRWRAASWIALAVIVPLAGRMALDSGITWDEGVQRGYGDLVLEWYRSGFTVRGALDYHNLYLYGGLFDLPAQWIVATGASPWGAYETRHMLTSLVAVLGIVAVWLAANRIAGPRAGFIAAAVIALTPTWTGHGLFNPKDIPFATAAAFLLYSTVCIAMRPSPLTWWDALRTAVSLGFALGVRPGGMFLVAYPFAAAGLRAAADCLQQKHAGLLLGLRRLAISLARLLLLLPVSWALMLSAWPWAQTDPFVRPFQAAEIATRFGWGGEMLFDGAKIGTGHIPDSYLPVWFGVTLPEFYFVGLICGAVILLMALRNRPSAPGPMIALFTIATFVILPFVAVIVMKPTIYDAHRHFLFLMPAMALLAGLSLDHFVTSVWAPRWIRGAVVVLALAAAITTLYDMWSLHPLQYVYFNRISGGLPRQVDRFETDYWGASYREGFEWLVRNYDRGGSRVIRVSSCHFDSQLRYYKEQLNAERFEITKKSEIDLAFTRGDCRNRPGEIIHVVQRQGAPLLYVRRK